MKRKQVLGFCAIGLVLLTLLGAMVFVVSQPSHHIQAAGQGFKVQGSQIIDPNGKPFLVKGVNINGPNWVWSIEMTQYVDKIGSGGWNFNLVRVNTLLNGNNQHDNDDMDKIVNAFTSRGIVVMFEAHDWTGGYPAGSYLTKLSNWWKGVANKYKDNPYVWFDSFNEPGDCKSPVDPNWKTAHQSIISAIRDGAGANNLIIAEDNGWAQGTACSGSDAILQYGDSLLNFNGKTYGNIVFNTHIYCGWNNSNGLGAYLDKITQKFALFIGEFGVFGGANCDATSSVQKMYDALATRSIGRVVWQWYGGDGNNLTNTDNPSGGWKIDNTNNPTNLTWLGKMIWKDTHSGTIPIAPNPTATPAVPAPTSTVIPTAVPTNPPVNNASPNNVGISNNGKPFAANYDGAGNSYSAQTLQAAGIAPGKTVNVNGVAFSWPKGAIGKMDNYNSSGQKISLAAKENTTTVAFLGSSTNGPSVGKATLVYTDGTKQTFNLGFSDWTLNAAHAQPDYGNKSVALMPYRNTAENREVVNTYLFYTDVTLQAGKIVQSVVLPSSATQGQLHVFAVAMK